jgi:hypothetical protein
MNNHSEDFFWFAINPDKRYTKNKYIVLGRGSLDEEPGVHMVGLNLRLANLEAGAKNNFATANANYHASLKEE